MQLVPGEPNLSGTLLTHGYTQQEAEEGQGWEPAQTAREVYSDSWEASSHFYCG